MTLDVRDEASVTHCFQALYKQYGRLDVLINNAGIGVFRPFEDISLAEWDDVLRTNLTGAFLCCRAAFPLLRNTGGGRIINIGSVADRVPLAGNAAYGASKFGLRGLSQILSEEGKDDRIRVTHLSLGAVYTAPTTCSPRTWLPRCWSTSPGGRWTSAWTRS
jgi:NAD(P)-dependent dehydrogenase (short-subunit alcohol dehydrogenase family)